ncbi:hyaluronidase-5-like [Anoplopoma fimbria]|uniref:hyaluronidase-5-like n=1 Tax=Anoplopoma fimbria TaxID=229290 RepID=UPI0023EBF3CE|nr:hyaluronidase-5-like [Anoplopoma fimbria]XP_054476224.1 hyaluronidase-5-like [Anoplopoma fimbria]XP_054476225.1 hyaluronidase-5-like [Anoplopoma fimbria]
MIQLNLLDDKRFFPTFITTLTLLCSVRALPRTDPPLHKGHPFMLLWNAPTELCRIHFNMPLDLSYFHLVSSTLKTATNQSISIFYTDRFGLFPYVDEDTGEMYEEGLPQLIDLQEHHDHAEDDIEHYIPGDQRGLAVLDFEEWRPQWVRNWGSKDIYRQISIETVQKKNASLTEDEAEDRAKIVFERGAKRYFLRSIRLGKALRPNRLWGYYLYPDCYNYDYNKDMAGFTGECPAIEKERNNELMWLWKESTALFPSIYLELLLRDSRQARQFVRHRIQEAMRVSTLPNSSYSIPIYAYIRPVYKDSTDDYMSEFDLVNTIGEAAALGAAGVVSWGDMNVTETEDSCFDARRHLEQVMNPYALNVSTATRLCSQALCQGRGRCVRKRWDEDVFLHLDPRRYRIEQKRSGGPLTVNGGLSQEDVNWFDRSFDCMCYGEEPCRSVLTFNVIHRAVITTGNGGAHRPRPLLLVSIVLSLKYVVMRI